jgi:tape measure domain-containing protein
VAYKKVLAEFDAVDNMSKTLLRMEQNVGHFATGSLTAFGRVEKGMAGLLSSAAALRNISGLVAGGFGVSIGTQFLDTANRIKNSLREVGGASDEAFKEVYLASTRSLAEFETFAAGVQKFQKVLGDKQSFSESVRQLETLNKLMALNGKSTQERASTMLQFTQALQAGNLGGEELRAVRENSPIELIRAIAREAGGSVEQLKKFGAQGKLTTDVMIRALKSLEQEADKRIKPVIMLMAQAKDVMESGAIVASAGFDKGAGISSAVVSGLTALGKVLGESADAFEVFGQAARLAAGAFAAGFAGRQITGAVNGFTAYSKALRDTASGTQALVKAEELKLRSARSSVLLNTQILSGLTAENSSKRQVATATTNLAKSQKIANAAALAYARASTVAAAAQARLALGARLLAGSMSILRGAFAFLGGVPGLLLIAGTALLMLSSSAETAAERIERLRESTDKAATAGDSLREVQSRLADTMTETGNASSAASEKIIGDTRAEIAVKRELLAAQNANLIAAQAERQEAIAAARIALANAEGRLSGVKARAEKGGLGSGSAKQLIPELEEGYRLAREQLAQLNADSQAAQKVIAENVKILGSSLIDAQLASGGLLDSVSKVAGWLGDAAISAGGIAGSNMSGAIDPAATAAQRLVAYLGQAWAWVKALSGVSGPTFGSLNNLPVSAGAHRNEADSGFSAPVPLPETDMSGDAHGRWVVPPVTIPDAPGGGGGGGGSKTNKDMEEALRIIEATLSVQEKQAKELREMTALRERLVATYGVESEIVQQLDVAISKTKGEMEGLSSITGSFFSTLSDELASSIEDWKGWGDFVRSTLASLVSEWGPDFFAALFTPGTQEGSSPGTSLGNILTGAISGSGSASTANLSTGRVSLPQGGQASASTVTVVMNNDFRGTDPGMKGYIDGQLQNLQREFPAQVYAAIDRGKRNRRL